MKRANLLLILISLAAVLLAGCNARGPSNAEAKEVIYGVYFLDARILGKRQCELTPKMQEDGVTNVWLIRYKVKDTGSKTVMLISEGDSEKYPWVSYMSVAGTSAKAVEENCP